MLFTSTALVLPLLAIANGSPVFNPGDQAIARRSGTYNPSNLPPPPPGKCSLLVFSAIDLPLGSVPTSVQGGGIAPSEQGSPECAVINVKKQFVGGPKALKPQSPGFAASIALDPDRINHAGTVTVTADFIANGEKDWGIKYKYAGKEYSESKCEYHNENTGGLGAYAVQQCNFPC